MKNTIEVGGNPAESPVTTTQRGKSQEEDCQLDSEKT